MEVRNNDPRTTQNLNYWDSDPYKCEVIRTYDCILHEALNQVLLESCSNLLSDQVKCMIEQTLEQEPVLSQWFTKSEFDQIPLLWIAVLGCYQKSAKLLVRSGADVLKYFGHSTKFHQVELYDKSTILHVLLQMYPSWWNEAFIRIIVAVKKRAILKARDDWGRTALHYAVKTGRSFKLIKMLLWEGADVNIADHQGVTALHAAIENSQANEQLVPLLLKFGAAVSAKDTRGYNSLHYLANASYLSTERAADLAKIFIKYGAPLESNTFYYNNSPIHLAINARGNDLQLIEIFLEKGTNVNVANKAGRTPLHFALESSQATKLVPLLLRYGADVLNIVNDTQTLKTWLRRSANICLKRKSDGCTALHRACQLHNEGSIRLLLSIGEDILAEDNEGTTPFATMMNCPKGDSDIRLMVLKELALKKVGLKSSIELKDERTIKKYPEMWDNFQNCIAEINMMKSMSRTLFDLLTKSHRQIAPLMRNPEFEAGFWQFDLQTFPMYAKNIGLAFERASRHHCKTLEKENVIIEAFYNSLPDVVVRKLIRYILNDIDCCADMIDVEYSIIADYKKK